MGGGGEGGTLQGDHRPTRSRTSITQTSTRYTDRCAIGLNLGSIIGSESRFNPRSSIPVQRQGLNPGSTLEVYPLLHCGSSFPVTL